MTRGLRIIVDYRPALRARTGVGEYVHEMTLALASVLAADRAGEVIAFSSSWSDRLDASGLPGVATIDARVPVRILNLAWHRLGWPPIERFAGAVDVAHSGHPLLMPARAAVQAVTIHDLDFLDHPERTRREVRRDYPSLSRAHAKRADLIVVSSRDTASRVAAVLGVPDRQIVLCPAGAPPWAARKDAPSRGYFLFVGTLEPRKNVAGLLDAYERLVARVPDAPALKLAGRALPESAGWLARIGRPPLAARVTHLGYVEPAEKRELFAGALALLIPSLHEGFGMTALEAMAAGVPTIASNRGALPEVLGEAALYVDPEREESLTSAMERVMSDPVLRRTLSEAGKTRAAMFSWTASAARLLDAYRAAISRRRRP